MNKLRQNTKEMIEIDLFDINIVSSEFPTIFSSNYVYLIENLNDFGEKDLQLKIFRNVRQGKIKLFSIILLYLIATIFFRTIIVAYISRPLFLYNYFDYVK